MKPVTTIGCPDIDGPLAQFPEALIKDIGPYEQRVGYKCWKVPGRTRPEAPQRGPHVVKERLIENWLQWNDGGTPLRIRFASDQGQVRTWKLFARFGSGPKPRGPWDKPEKYEREKDQWMLAGGSDVWGCSCEDLRAYLGRFRELEELLRDDLKLSYRYSIQRYAGLGS